MRKTHGKGHFLSAVRRYSYKLVCGRKQPFRLSPPTSPCFFDAMFGAASPGFASASHPHAVWPIQTSPQPATFGQQGPGYPFCPAFISPHLPVASLGVQCSATLPGPVQAAPVVALPVSTPVRSAVTVAARPEGGTLPKGRAPGGVSSKKDTKERQYSQEEYQRIVCAVLRGVSVRKACEDAGYPSARSVVTRQVAEIRAKESLQHLSPEVTLECQLAYAAELSFKLKGNLDFTSRRIFGADDLEYFARAIKIYGDLGWPMDYYGIQSMMAAVVKERGLTDWRSGELFTVSLTYARDFVKSRPDLQAYKASNIDPLRAKSATEMVCLYALGSSHSSQQRLMWIVIGTAVVRFLGSFS